MDTDKDGVNAILDRASQFPVLGADFSLQYAFAFVLVRVHPWLRNVFDTMVRANLIHWRSHALRELTENAQMFQMDLPKIPPEYGMAEMRPADIFPAQ